MKKKYFLLILYLFISSIVFTNSSNQVSSYGNTIKNDLIEISALDNNEQLNLNIPSTNMIVKIEGKIEGLVHNRAHRPIPEALVKFSITGISPPLTYQQEIKSDKEGKFEIKYSIAFNNGIPLYSLRVSAKDYLENEIKDIQLRYNHPKICLEFKSGGKVIGRVVKKPNYESVPEANVILSGPQNLSEKTDANGEFKFSNIIPGEYNLNVQKELLFQKVPVSFEISENEIKDNITIDLDETYTVTGKVIEKDTNKPIANLLLKGNYSYTNNNVTTGEDGSYTFENVYADLNIYISSDTYLSVEPDTKNGYDKKVILGDNYFIDNQDIYVKKGLRIKGTVLSVDNKSVNGAEIEIVREDTHSRRYWTDTSGQFSFPLESGTHFQLIASNNNYATTVSPEYFAKDSPIEDIVLVLKNGGTIEGKVLSDKNLPLSEVDVSTVESLQVYQKFYNHNPQYSRTDEEGKFRLKNIAPGTVLLSAHSKNLDITKQFEIKLIKDKNITDLIIILSKGLSIKGKVFNENDEPLEGIRVSAHNLNWSSYNSSKTDKEGYYELKGLIYDCFKIFVGDDSNTYIGINKDNVSSGSTDVNFILKRKISQIISGKIVDIKTFDPINSFKISHNGKEYEFSDTNGLFTLPEPIIIPTRITVLAQDYLPKDYSVKEAQKEHIIALGKGGTIKGRIVSKIDNKPIEGAKISLNIGGRDNVKIYSNNAGEFVISGLPYQGYWFYIKAEGFVDKKVNAMAWEKETNDMGDIYLGTGCKIFGKVYDENNLVCKNIDLSVQNIEFLPSKEQPFYGTVTNEKGYYEFKGLPTGRYLISSRSLNAIYQNIEFEEENEEKQVDFHLTGTVAKINVMLNGEGIVDAVIEANSEKGSFQGKTGYQGNFSIKGIKADSYDLYIVYGKFTVWIEEIIVKEGAENDFTFNISDSCVSGRFLNKDNEPIKDVIIVLFIKKLEYYDKEVRKRHSYITTDSNGCFEFHYVPPGEYVLGASSAWSPSVGNNDCAVKKLSINFGEDIENVDLKIGEGRVLEILAKDSQTNQPLPYTNVALRSPFIHVQTNTDGKVWLWGFWSDTYHCRLYKAEYEFYDTDFTISEEQINQKEFLLIKK